MVSFGLVGRCLRLQIPDVSPASVASETSGICNQRPRPTSPKDTIYYIDSCRENLYQYKRKEK